MIMHIYIPCDIDRLSKSNPFLSELINSLILGGATVETNLKYINSSPKPWDVIHIHWPEFLFYDSSMTIIEKVDLTKSFLRIARINSKIVSTIHNLSPHFSGLNNYHPLYAAVYEYTDEFVHLGPASIDLLSTIYRLESKNKKHTIIPHGNYEVYGPVLSIQDAKNCLNFQPNKTIVSLGLIRHPTEALLLLKVAHECSLLGVQFIYAGKISFFPLSFKIKYPLVSRLFAKLLTNFFKIVFCLYKPLSYIPGFVPFKLMNHYVSAADILLIPRFDILNSGSLALGFTYGAVVLGPDVGNVGSILKATNNSVFNPALDNLKQSILNALDLVDNNHGKINLKYSHDVLNWAKIGSSHLELYSRICSTTPSTC